MVSKDELTTTRRKAIKSTAAGALSVVSIPSVVSAEGENEEAVEDEENSLSEVKYTYANRLGEQNFFEVSREDGDGSGIMEDDDALYESYVVARINDLYTKDILISSDVVIGWFSRDHHTIQIEVEQGKGERFSVSSQREGEGRDRLAIDHSQFALYFDSIDSMGVANNLLYHRPQKHFAQVRKYKDNWILSFTQPRGAKRTIVHSDLGDEVLRKEDMNIAAEQDGVTFATYHFSEEPSNVQVESGYYQEITFVNNANLIEDTRI